MAEEMLPQVPRELWRERLRASRPIGEVVAQGGEVAMDWRRGNIPLQLNGIVMSPQAEAQLGVLLQHNAEPEDAVLELATGGAKPMGFVCSPFLGNTLCTPTKSR